MANTALDPHAAITTTASGVVAQPLTTADGKPLVRALARSQSRARRRAFLLVLPLLAFILVTFVVPIGQMLQRSFHNDGFSANMPNVSAWFAQTERGTQPDDAAWQALATDLQASAEARNIGVVGTRVNYDMPGTRSLFTSTGRKVRDGIEPPYRDALLAIDEEWGDPQLWATMREVSSPYTANFYLASVDRTRDVNGDIQQVDENQRVYVMLFWRTFWLSGLITLLTFVLGFPIAHLLATLPMRKSNLLMILVLLPFWTSLLVRTASWVVLLQEHGLVNDTLMLLGLIDEPLRMIYNRVGVYIAMTHILLPFMILPLYSVMKGISPRFMRAAVSLGASPTEAFIRVYLPLTMSGIAAGTLLVFIMALGYYITPALVGGAADQMISYFIAFYTSDTVNWGMAAALGTVLLVATLVLYGVYNRLVGINNMKLG